MRVLLIEDEPTTTSTVDLMLTTEGFNVHSTNSGEEGLELAKLHDYDIILVDLNLPVMHGYDVLQKLHTAKVQAPVLFLSGDTELECKTRSFGLAANDYVTKPFHREALVARIRAVVRRSMGHSQSVIRTGKLAVNFDTKMVDVNGTRVHITVKEYSVLELLSLRKGTTITKADFVCYLYDTIVEPYPGVIKFYIFKLRKKLMTACCGENYIETVWGQGYALRDPE